jgi:hypothetical protein
MSDSFLTYSRPSFWATLKDMLSLSGESPSLQEPSEPSQAEPEHEQEGEGEQEEQHAIDFRSSRLHNFV